MVKASNRFCAVETASCSAVYRSSALHTYNVLEVGAMFGSFTLMFTKSALCGNDFVDWPLSYMPSQFCLGRRLGDHCRKDVGDFSMPE